MSIHIVDVDTGEIREGCELCLRVKDQLAGANSDLAKWRTKFFELQRDRQQDAKESFWYPAGRRVFNWWRQRCSHPKAKWSVDRFELIEPFLIEDGEKTCMSAVSGAAFDAYVTVRKNGSTQRHDGWELVFRNRGKFEEFVNRAPRSVWDDCETGDTQVTETPNVCAWCGQKANEQVRITTRTARKMPHFEWACSDCTRRLQARYGDKMGVDQK